MKALEVIFITQCKYIVSKTFEVLFLSFFYRHLKKINRCFQTENYMNYIKCISEDAMKSALKLFIAFYWI